MSQSENLTRKYRVLHALTGAAGQARALSLALRESGVAADCVLLGESRLGYKADHYIKRSGNDLRDIVEFLKRNIDNYDIFHFHFRPFFYENSRDHRFPSFLDLLLIKAAGKKIVFHFRGSEVRFNDTFKKMSPYNYVDENTAHLINRFPDQAKRRHIELVESIADAVLVNDPEIGSYVGESTIINRIVDPGKFTYCGVSDTDCPLIIHAPSRRGVKGTDHILAAVETLRAEGLSFNFQLIENLNHDQALEAYKKADVIVDQLRIGWYGVLSVEAMSLGKAVLCYIRDDLAVNFNGKTPLLNTNPDTITENLRRVIVDKQLRQSLSQNGYDWYTANHHRGVVTEKLIKVYDDVTSKTKPCDVKAYLELIDYQKTLSSTHDDPSLAWERLGFYDGGWHPKKVYSKAAFLLETQGVRSVFKRTVQRLFGKSSR